MILTPLSLLILSLIFAMFFPLTGTFPRIPVDKKEFYREYMQSAQWKRKRRLRIKIDKGRCAKFHLLPVKSGLQVHHLNYKRLGDESVKKDLITLCGKCHRKEHGRGRTII